MTISKLISFLLKHSGVKVSGHMVGTEPTGAPPQQRPLEGPRGAQVESI